MLYCLIIWVPSLFDFFLPNKIHGFFHYLLLIPFCRYSICVSFSVLVAQMTVLTLASDKPSQPWPLFTYPHLPCAWFQYVKVTQQYFQCLNID